MTQIPLFDTSSQTELVDILEVSEILGVSSATIRNWIKAGQISYVSKSNVKGKFFDKRQIEQLKKDIQNGRTAKLNNRANKRNSTSTFIPVEQLRNKSLLPRIQSYIDMVNKFEIPIQTALLIHSLSVLKKSGLATYSQNIARIDEIAFKNQYIENVLVEWNSELGTVDFPKYKNLLAIDDIFSSDSLGVLYQSLLDEGKKSQGGSYYTPSAVIQQIAEQLSSNIHASTKFLDPCCGTGQFLIAFAHYISNPLLLWGYDIDPIAVHIAKVNLLVTYPEANFYPNIFVANSLVDNPDGSFDIIATNPPWGYHFSKHETKKLKRIYPEIMSNEAFSYFIVRGIQLLHDGGSLCYVLPESIIKVKQHRDVRYFLLTNNSIQSIRHLGNVFSKVLSPVITLIIEKGIKKNNEVEIVHKDKSETKIRQVRFTNNPDYTFDTTITKEDELLINKIYKKGIVTLKNNAEWALGIVTGSNNKFIADVKNDNNEAILKGSDINKYTCKQVSSFIKFTPVEFQQVAPEWKYRAKEKLIYKFISSELAFAYDNKQTVTLNSANILIPKISDIPIKVILAFLNSDVFQYLWKKKCNTVKVLRGDLEQLPFPKMDDILIAEIEKNVNDVLSSDRDKQKIVKQLNELVSNAFELTSEEKQYIQKEIKK